MWGFLTQTRYWAEWLTAHTDAADAAAACGQFSGQAWLLNNLGTAFRELDRLDESRAAFAAGVEIRVRIGDRHGQADSLKDMAMAARVAGDFDEAARLATEALEIMAQLHEPDVSGTASALDTAVADYLSASQVFERIADDWGQAEVLRDVGAVLANAGRGAEAAEYWWRAVAHYRVLGADRAADELTTALDRLTGEPS